LTIGPVLFNWPADHWRDFYLRVADEAPVDHVCIGEVVCSRRQPLFSEAMPDIIDRLERSGKAVLLSSLALPTLERELRCNAALGSASHMVEANDVSMLRALTHRPHAIGPFVNVYNEATAAFLASRGAKRIALPPELPKTSIRAIAAAAPEAAIEVWAFGRIPLAISARCYHARLNGRTKDSCQFVCDKDPDGIEVATIDDQKFLAINGVQALSHTYCGLVNEAAELTMLGVAALRLSPHTCDMIAVARLFRDVLDQRREPRGDVATARDLPRCNVLQWVRPMAPRRALFANVTFDKLDITVVGAGICRPLAGL
jgi:collagenase-like PrtC family protease